jgi:hypothetical protein
MFAMLDRQSVEIVLFLCFALVAGWSRRRANEPRQQPVRIAVRKLQAVARRWCA